MAEVAELADETSPLVRYTVCRWAFWLVAIACGVMAFDGAAHTLLYFPITREVAAFNRDLERFLMSNGWQWVGSSVVVWCSLLGSFLLVGRWPDRSWNRRASWLVLTSFAGVAFWFLRHAHRLGLSHGEMPWQTERMHLMLAFRWVWLATLASMASDVCDHLGRADARALRSGMLSLIGIGVALWLINVLTYAQLAAGLAGPRAARLLMSLRVQWLGFTAMRCAATFAATSFVLITARECTKVLRELSYARDGAMHAKLDSFAVHDRVH